jgi:hypothetical protein
MRKNKSTSILGGTTSPYHKQLFLWRHMAGKFCWTWAITRDFFKYLKWHSSFGQTPAILMLIEKLTRASFIQIGSKPSYHLY